MDNENNKGLVKQNKIAQSEIEAHLSDSERNRLSELEEKIELAKSAFEQAAFIMGEALAEISKSKLYRETHRTFGDYVIDRFGITREYAHSILKTASYRKIAMGELELDEKNPFSVNTWIAFKTAINKIAKQIGVGGKDIENQLQGIMRQSLKILYASAPKENNLPVVTPQLMNHFFETVDDYLNLQTVNINGQQLTLEEAKNKGLQATIIEAAQESILLNAEVIKSTTLRKKESKVTNKTSEFTNDVIEPAVKNWRSAEQNAAEYIKALPNVREVEDVSDGNYGYDLAILFKDGRRLYVEVKSVSSFNEPFKITNNEYSSAHKYGNNYDIALVINSKPIQIRFISNPLENLTPKKVCERWSWKFEKYTTNLQENL